MNCKLSLVYKKFWGDVNKKGNPRCSMLLQCANRHCK